MNIVAEKVLPGCWDAWDEDAPDALATCCAADTRAEAIALCRKQALARAIERATREAA